MTPEQPMGISVDTLRRLIAWERRVGPPMNSAMARFYDWLFVVVGPVGVGFGVLTVVSGFWQGSIILLLGLGMTWAGWVRLVRFARSRLGRQV